MLSLWALLTTAAASIALLAVGASGQTAGYSVFDPHPDATRTADGAWSLHDMNRPWPPAATPKPWPELVEEAKPPQGAAILFDGSSLDAWVVPQPWRINDAALQVRPVNSSLATKDSFGSCRLHLEWRTPPGNPEKTGQNRGNSGVFLMSAYEIQVLDTYENKTYADGMAAALYGVKPPDVNALRPAGEWQSYDIWFKRPIFDDSGKMTFPAFVTVLVNGVLVQNNIPFNGPSSHKTRRPYQKHTDALPLMLQNHNDTVEFRNIWIQSLPDDAVISPAGPVGIKK
jgi:hypothetical protein